MAIARRCDRCGGYFSPAEEKGEYCRFSNPTVMTGESYSQNRSMGRMVKIQDNVLEIFKEDDIDLCPKCTELLKKFMRNEPFEISDKIEIPQPKILKWPKLGNLDRVYIRYAEDGGTEKEGVIEIRKGVKDLDLGDTGYAQVRIPIDDDYYMKGMAIYSDDIPDGFDIVYNTRYDRRTPLFKHGKSNDPSVFEKYARKTSSLMQ